MITTALQTFAQDQLALDQLAQGGGLGTGGLRQWILDNLVPLLLLSVALLLLWLGGGKGDNAGVMRRLGGVLVALAAPPRLSGSLRGAVSSRNHITTTAVNGRS